MIAGIFRTKPTVPPWHAHQARPSVAIATCVLTRRGYAIETTIVKTNGMRAKRCVTIRPAKPTVSAVPQGIVFPCVGTAMERMTVETGVMKGPVEQRTRHASVSSSHVAMVCFVLYLTLLSLGWYVPSRLQMQTIGNESQVWVNFVSPFWIVDAGRNKEKNIH